LDGDEPGLEENLVAYCRLEHRAPVQLVVGSLDPRDVALAVAERVAEGHRGADVVIVRGAALLGANRKASLLAALSARARHPIVVAVDSDVRVGRDYLERLLPALLRAGVGLATCLYRAPRPHRLAEAYEALCINVDFVPSVMLARNLGRQDLAFGS